MIVILQLQFFNNHKAEPIKFKKNYKNVPKYAESN